MASREVLPSAVRVGVGHSQGLRPRDEDAWFVLPDWPDRPGAWLLGVLDGHGGAEASRLASEWLPSTLARGLAGVGPEEAERVRQAFVKAFVEVSARLGRVTGSGTTAAVAWLVPPHLWYAWVGDSGAVLGRRDGTPLRLTRDHRLDHPEERRRLRALGARFWGPYLLAPDGVSGLMVTRALGDPAFQGLVLAEPEVGYRRLEAEDCLLLLACDGLWDALEDASAVALALHHPDPQEGAHALVDRALARGSTDNITVVVARWP